MMQWLKGKNDANGVEGPPPAKLLVIQADAYNWEEIVGERCLADGRRIQVFQCGWEDMSVAAEGSTGSKYSVIVHLCRKAATPKCPAVPPVSFMPDFVLVRNEVFTPAADHRNLLFGLMFADVPGANSLSSIHSFSERPLIMGELHKISRRLGADVFPVVPQNYFASFREMMYTQAFPAVVKVGAAHAGMGKMRINDHHDMEDFRTVLAMTEGKYCTAEPYMEGEFDLRIQKIGNHYRAFKRQSMSGTWKTNTGSSHIEDVELTPTYKRWADEASTMFGGLDICTVDALHRTSDGSEVILEVNGGSSGLAPHCEDEDNQFICDLVVEKMNALLCSPINSDG